MTVELNLWQIISLVVILVGTFVKFYTDSAKRFAKLETEMHEIQNQNKLLFSKLDRIQESMTEMKIQIAKTQ